MTAIAEPRPVEAVTDLITVQTSSGPVRVSLAWADKACKRCYGTGKVGTEIAMSKGKPTGSRTHILCLCVSREAARRQAAKGKAS